MIKIDNLKDAVVGSIIAMGVFALLIYLGFIEVSESPPYPLFIKDADAVAFTGMITFIIFILLEIHLPRFRLPKHKIKT